MPNLYPIEIIIGKTLHIYILMALMQYPNSKVLYIVRVKPVQMKWSFPGDWEMNCNTSFLHNYLVCFCLTFLQKVWQNFTTKSIIISTRILFWLLLILSFCKLSSKSDMRRKMTERNKSLGGVKKAKKMKEIVEILWETLTNLLKQKTK